MEDIFKREICPFCEKFNGIECNEHIIFKQDEFNVKRMCCSNYAKNEAKIVPYEKPLEVTARRSYVKNREI